MSKSVLITVISIVVIIYAFGVWVDYDYERRIGAFMNNAVDMNTPGRMLEQLDKAEAGMRAEGLVETDYGALIFKKEDNSMRFQYQHIDSIRERINAVQTWLDQNYNNNTGTTETLGDVYEEKMTNLRNFIKEDVRSDWIAKRAWTIKHYPWYYIVTFGSAGQTRSGGITTLIVAFLLFFFLYPKLMEKREGYRPPEQF